MRFTSTPPPAGAHGGDGAAIAEWLGVAVEEVLDLSASLNPFAPPVPRLVADAAGAVGRYPDAAVAEEELAAAIGVDPTRLVLTNGGAEAIALVAALEPVGWVEAPEFALYERHLAEVQRGAPRWRSNPSNPSGRLAGPNEAAEVWDEAFYPLATGWWTRGDDHAWRLGSLTKLWACPGLRLGYAIAPDGARAEALRARQPHWSVGALALAVMSDLLLATDLPAWAKRITAQRARLRDELSARGARVHDTDAPWVLVEADGLRERLAPAGVVVRDCASFGLVGTARIAVPDDDGLERLLAALDDTDRRR